MKNKRMIVNISASIIVFLVQIGINFVLSPYILQQLGEEANGFINLANSFVQYATLLSVAVNSMANRYISVNYQRGNIKEANSYFTTVFSVNVFLITLVSLVSMFMVFSLENFILMSPKLVFQVKMTFMLSFINFSVSLLTTVYSASAFATNRMDINSMQQIVVNVVKGALIFGFFVFFTPKIYYVSLAALLSSVVAVVINYVITRKLTPDLKIHINSFSFHKVKVLLTAGGWSALSSLSNLMLTGLDLLLANLMVSPILMGRLAVAKTLPGAVGTLLTYFAAVFTASFTEIYAKNDMKLLVKENKNMLRMMAVLLTVPFAGIIVFGVDFLHLWLRTAEYTDAQLLQIYILMLLELVNIIANAYMYSVHSIFIVLVKVKMYSLMIFISSIVSIGCTAILVKYTSLGVYAIAGTSTVILSVVNIFLVPMYAAKLLKEPTFSIVGVTMKSFMALGITCLLFLPIRYLTSINSWGSFIGVAALAAVIGYILNIFLLYSREERKGLAGQLKAKLKR